MTLSGTKIVFEIPKMSAELKKVALAILVLAFRNNLVTISALGNRRGSADPFSLLAARFGNVRDLGFWKKDRVRTSGLNSPYPPTWTIGRRSGSFSAWRRTS